MIIASIIPSIFGELLLNEHAFHHMAKNHWRNSQDPSGGCNRKSWVKIWVPKSWVISICSHENWCILPWRVGGLKNITGLFFHILGIIIGSD